MHSIIRVGKLHFYVIFVSIHTTCKFLIDYTFSPTNSVEKYKITPCDSANAFGGTIPNNIGTNSATNGSGRGTGGNFIFFTVEIGFFVQLISQPRRQKNDRQKNPTE